MPEKRVSDAQREALRRAERGKIHAVYGLWFLCALAGDESRVTNDYAAVTCVVCRRRLREARFLSDDVRANSVTGQEYSKSPVL